jgi:hypothetical protein
LATIRDDDDTDTYSSSGSGTFTPTTTLNSVGTIAVLFLSAGILLLPLPRNDANTVIGGVPKAFGGAAGMPTSAPVL